MIIYLVLYVCCLHFFTCTSETWTYEQQMAGGVCFTILAFFIPPPAMHAHTHTHTHTHTHEFVAGREEFGN